MEHLITDLGQIPILYEKQKTSELLSKLKIMFKQIFEIVISSDRDDNYEWLPPLATASIIPNLLDNLMTVCTGLNTLVRAGGFIYGSRVELDTPHIIKNDGKIVDYLLERNPDINSLNLIAGEITPLYFAIFRMAPAEPSAYIVEKLLVDGAELQFNTKIEEDGTPKGIQDMLTIQGEPWNLFKRTKYADEYANITKLLYQACAIQLILATPYTTAFRPRSPQYAGENWIRSAKSFQEQRGKFLKMLQNYHPEAFTYYRKHPLPEGTALNVREIDPEGKGYNVVDGEVDIKEYLSENKKLV